MSSGAVMPAWFAVYPECDVGVVQDCIRDIESACLLVRSLRDQILDIESLVKRDGAGVWFDEYSRYSQRVWGWLGDVCVVLGRLAGSMEDVACEARRAQWNKEQSWVDVQRYIRPSDFGVDIVPVSSSVALRDYACFRTRECPLSIPYLHSPLTFGIVIDSAVNGLSQFCSRPDMVSADTDALRRASDAWCDIKQRYQNVLCVLETVAQAWGRGCGGFSPANFTPLLEALYGFVRIADQQAENLAQTAQRFDQTQEELLASFNWTGPVEARLAGVRTDSYIDPWGHGSEHRDRPVLEAFFRGLGQGAKDTVSVVGGLLGVIWLDGIQPDLLDGPEKELEDSVSAFIDDPLGTLSAVWDSIAQSFQTPEGAAEFFGGIAGGAGAAGLAARGIKTIGKALKTPEIPLIHWPEHIQKLTPDEAVDYAKGSQGTRDYPNVDVFSSVEIKPGDIYYRGEPGGGDFFTTKEAIDSVGAKQKELFKGLQVKKHKDYGYRPTMQGYRYVGDESFYAAKGDCLANNRWGDGGLEQRVIPNTQELIDAGLLVPVDEITLITE